MREVIHSFKCGAIETWRRFQADRRVAQARQRVERRAEQHREHLAQIRQKEFAALKSDTPERSYPNLDYPIEQARQLALARFSTQKDEAMEKLMGILSTGEHFTLRQLGILLGKAPNTVRAYRAELMAMGVLPTSRPAASPATA